MSGFYLLVDLHWEGSAPEACAAGLFPVKKESDMKCFVCLIIDSMSGFITLGLRIKDSGKGPLNILLLPGT